MQIPLKNSICNLSVAQSKKTFYPNKKGKRTTSPNPQTPPPKTSTKAATLKNFFHYSLFRKALNIHFHLLRRNACATPYQFFTPSNKKSGRKDKREYQKRLLIDLLSLCTHLNLFLEGKVNAERQWARFTVGLVLKCILWNLLRCCADFTLE